MTAPQNVVSAALSQAAKQVTCVARPPIAPNIAKSSELG
jgi:hypothetical protein